ncbi:hypothetical protein FACS1894122_12620 [Alphaproteobacteria bacterium]|nr:hypothetical protein FACS1894122_12620 [Alphaproteobacteria bacterium]
MAKKAYHHVTRDLRCQIAALKSIGYTQRKIALEAHSETKCIKWRNNPICHKDLSRCFEV